MQPHQVRSSYFLLITFILLNFSTPMLNEVEHHNLPDGSKQTNKQVTTGSATKKDECALSSKDLECVKLREPCIKCDYNESCVYGSEMNITCKVEDGVTCEGNRKFERSMVCQYCYQTPHWQHKCVLKASCSSVSSPITYYRTNCTVNNDVLCLGKRRFPKNVRCNWTGGYRWSKAFLLSITLGGFGADRFYLGHWQDGVGKLFSFGGLGVWTLIDVILISIHYLGPADGSLYV